MANDQETKKTFIITRKTLGRFTIEQGPGLVDLQAAVFRGDVYNRFPVRMKIADGNSFVIVQMIINGVDREDPNGVSWSFRGYVQQITMAGALANSQRLLEFRSGLERKNLIGSYAPHTRHGFVQLADELVS